MENFLNTVKQMTANLKELWDQMNLNRKVLSIGMLAFIICIVVVAWASATRVNYEPLYTQLSDKDAGAIIAKLDEARTPYRLEDNGSTILVPAEVKYNTRLKLAEQNLPLGESGFELFRESTSFGETQTDKRVKYLEALQGELARTIQRLDKVKAAKVNLALPEQSLFSDQEELSKASVVINTQPGQSLTPQEVQAVTNLVANSVERLKAENVVIVDQYGTLLSDALPQGMMAATSKLQMQLAMKREYEKEKQTAIQSMLDKTLGVDNAVVRVNAELNFNDREERSEIYSHDPEGSFVRSEEIIKESGTTPAAGAAPGTDANIPQYTEINDTEGSYDKSSTIRNYEIDKTETITRYAPGEVKYDYLTISVLVNNAATMDLKLGQSQEDKANTIRNIVATACGLRENRNNENVRLDENISVAFIEFNPQPEPEPDSLNTVEYLFQSGWMPWLMLGLVLLTCLAVFAGLRRRSPAPEVEAGVPISGYEAIVDDEVSLEKLIDKSMTPAERESQKIKEEIDKLVESNPENAAQVIKSWLLEN
ncbi:MAG: flagellar basal-body MS-ring/collar protein FliF [Syntrophomonadaceae bacterium]|jgi:flagellar M-ring protein FliF